MNNPVYQTVIVGGGFTGLFTALHLSRQNYPRSVILIDRGERFCFRPLLYEYFSGDMDAQQVVPRFEELLRGSGVIFVQDSVQSIDLHQRQVQLASGDCYNYSNLVLALGSVTNYFGVEGAKEYAFPFWTQENAIAIDKHLRNCLQQALNTEDSEKRRQLLTVAIIGGGPSGIEMAASLADLLPHWYEGLGGLKEEVRVVLLNQGKEILKGDAYDLLRENALLELQKRAVKVEMLMEAKATAVRPDSIEYKRDGKLEKLLASTTIWTTGTSTNPLIKDLAVGDEHRTKQDRLEVTATMQLPEFPEVFAGGDCVSMKDDSSLPPTAQVAYQQGEAIAHNLKALALENELKPAKVNLRGTLLKLGLEDAAANIFNTFEVKGELGHLIRQSTYLDLLPTPVHNSKLRTKWLNEEVFQRYLDSSNVGKTAVQTMQVVGIAVGRKLLQMLGDNEKS
ncbi:MAG: NAD(P)/FAD-dependent oxidoreductase [Rhizonema sp. PD37]|nr:NAD(P)/FAD-dependent oxidoreductase [Rhizonema sp. PD37]